METWRLLRTFDAEPGFNMGLDEALLEGTDERPTLRLYTWRPAALSLGYFQRLAELSPVARAWPLVRRLTGGGAIHHENELTFSIAAPLDHALYRGEVAESYLRVHARIARVLATCGVVAEPRGARRLDSDDDTSAMCFHRSTSIDLAWNGAKGVGSAQRRKAGRVLHHGSIKLATSALEGPIATVADAGTSLSPAAFAERLVAVWEADGTTFEAEEPSATELAHAQARAGWFSSPAFLERR